MVDSNIEKKDINKNLKLKKCSSEFCEDCTAHGLSNMVKTDSWIIRIAWIILIVVFCSYTAYTTVQSIFSFLSYETLTNFRSIKETKSDFPAVTICNLNAVDVGTNINVGKYIDKVLQFNNISPTINPTANQTAIDLINDAAIILKAYIIADNNLNASNLTREQIGFTLDTMLISCYFSGIKCSADDFYLYQTFQYGNCYTFNGLKNSSGNTVPVKQTAKSGPGTGLTLELFVGVAGKQDFYSAKRGIYVVVHNSTTKPLVQYGGVSVQTGASTNIKVSRVITKRLGSEFSSCRSDFTVQSDDSIYFKLASNYTTYTQKLCFDYYKQINIAIKYCGCNDPSLPLILDINAVICTNKANLTCVEIFKGNKNIEITDNDCPFECDTVDFETSIDSANYPTSYYSDILTSQTSIKKKFLVNIYKPGDLTPIKSLVGKRSVEKSDPIARKRKASQLVKRGISSSSNTAFPDPPPISQSDIATSFSMITVYYNDLGFTLVEESAAMDFITLLGIIGGQFGLFLGASFVTFFEILEFFVNLFRIALTPDNFVRAN